MQQPPYRVAVVHDNGDPDLSDLVNVPMRYEHSRCGEVTQCDVAITRNILREPLKLWDHGNVAGCNHCKKPQYPCREFTWVETGENVQDYYHALIAETHLLRPHAWLGPALKQAVVFAAVFAVVGVAFSAHLHRKLSLDPGTSGLMALGSLAVAALVGVLIVANHLVIRQKYLREYRTRFGGPAGGRGETPGGG